MWLPSAHLRYIAPDALPRRVSTKFDGRRLVGSDAAARDLTGPEIRLDECQKVTERTADSHDKPI